MVVEDEEVAVGLTMRWRDTGAVSPPTAGATVDVNHGRERCCRATALCMREELRELNDDDIVFVMCVLVYACIVIVSGEEKRKRKQENFGGRRHYIMFAKSLTTGTLRLA